MGGGVNSIPVSHQAVTVSRPNLSFEEVPLHRYNSVAWVAGKHTWEEMTLTIEDDVAGASTVIQEQLQKQQFLIGAEGPWLATAQEGSVYKFAAQLDMLNGNELVMERWTIEGCWIKQADYTDLDYTSSDAVQITLTIRFDHARQDSLSYQPGQGVATGGAKS